MAGNDSPSKEGQATQPVPPDFIEQVRPLPKQVRRRLLLIMVLHVDDLKIAGEKAEVDKVIAHLNKAFGSSDITYAPFTNCGVRHIQDKETNSPLPVGCTAFTIINEKHENCL